MIPLTLATLHYLPGLLREFAGRRLAVTVARSYSRSTGRVTLTLAGSDLHVGLAHRVAHEHLIYCGFYTRSLNARAILLSGYYGREIKEPATLVEHASSDEGADRHEDEASARASLAA